MKSKVLLIFLGALLLALALASCGKSAPKTDKYSFYESTMDTSKPQAWGEDSDIHVFCDDDVWKVMQDYLKSNLERETFVVVNEKYFSLIRSDLSDIDNLLHYKNLLFLGDLKSRGSVSQHMRATLDKRNLERVTRSGAEMFAAKNRWVQDQLIIYMLGSDLENLIKINLLQTDRLYNLFLNRLGERLAYQAYRTKTMPAEFFNDYPYSLQIPENFQLFQNDKANRVLSLLYRMRSESRDFPDKYITVYYEDMAADSVKLGWLQEKRKWLAGKYYDGDEFDPKMLRSERLNFGKYTAWRILGPWKNLKHDIGGGFQTFAFYDETQKRAYLIDNSVYFPAGDKLPVLLELQKISVTFRTK